MQNKKIIILPLVLLFSGCCQFQQVKAESKILNGCESQTNLNTMMLISKTSARITLSEEKVTEGSKSAKLEIECCPHFSSQTIVYQSLRNVADGLDYTNFSNYHKVTFDVYNDTDSVKTISVGAITRNTFQSGQDRQQDYTVQIQPKTWTNVVYNLDSSKLITFNGGKYACGIDISFLKAVSTDHMDVYYLDNFKVE